ENSDPRPHSACRFDHQYLCRASARHALGFALILGTMTTAYRALNDGTLPGVLSDLPDVRAQLGGTPDAWSVEEVGDGNLNLVFIVKGPAGAVVVKQALPYVRLVGDSWPLPLERSYYEHMALSEQAKHAPSLVPKIHHFDRDLALIVMEYLTPHII